MGIGGRSAIRPPLMSIRQPFASRMQWVIVQGPGSNVISKLKPCPSRPHCSGDGVILGTVPDLACVGSAYPWPSSMTAFAFDVEFAPFAEKGR